MLDRVQSDQDGTYQGFLRQVERSPLVILGQLPGARFTLAFWQVGQIDEWHFQRSGWADDLNRAIIRDHKGGAQRFVASHDLVQALLQRLHIEYTGEAKPGGTVIGRAVR